jgi:hypothetical protein
MYRKANGVGARIDVDQRVVFQRRGVDLDEAAHVPVMQLEPLTQHHAGGDGDRKSAVAFLHCWRP